MPGGLTGSVQSRRRILLLGRLAVASVALAAVVWLLRPARLADQLANVSLPIGAVALTLFIAGQALSALRWRVVAHRFGGSLSLREAVRAYLEGCFYNSFLPTGIGGDAYRAAHLRKWMTLRRAGTCVVLDRGAGLLALALTAGVLLPVSPYTELPRALEIVIVIAAATLAGTFCYAAFKRGLAKWLGWNLAFAALFALTLFLQRFVPAT